MEASRYSRLRPYAGFADTLSRWQAACCAVVGLGGLGGGLALHLARMGVRRLALIDRDLVGPENLGHQALYTEDQAHQGLPKAHAAVETLQQVNSSVDYVPVAGELNRNVIDGLLAGCDLLFDGLDSYYTRLLLNDYARQSGKPYFYAGVVRGELSVRAVISGVTGCLRCLLDRPPAPGEVPTCAAEGVFPPLLGVANALQLDLANRWLAGRFSAEDDVLYSLEVPAWRLRRLPLNGPDRQCPACQGRYEYLDGTLEALATHSCAGDRAEIILGTSIDLAVVRDRLAAGGGFALKENRFCLVAEAGAQRYTVFPTGRVILEGSDPTELNRFLATYLGV